MKRGTDLDANHPSSVAADPHEVAIGKIRGIIVSFKLNSQSIPHAYTVMLQNTRYTHYAGVLQLTYTCWAKKVNLVVTAITLFSLLSINFHNFWQVYIIGNLQLQDI